MHAGIVEFTNQVLIVNVGTGTKATVCRTAGIIERKGGIERVHRFAIDIEGVGAVGSIYGQRIVMPGILMGKADVARIGNATIVEAETDLRVR